jgi:transposase
VWHLSFIEQSTKATEMILHLTDKKWEILKQLLPAKVLKGRPQKWDDRQILEAILFILSNGLKWRCLPRTFPPYQTVYHRFRQWVDTGCLAAMRDTLIEVIFEGKSHLDMAFIDASFVRALCGGGDIGVTKLGKGNKIMAIVDEQSRPIAAIATSAQPHEITLLNETLQDCPILSKIVRIGGDKAYDSDSHDQQLAKGGIELIASHKKNRKATKTQDGRKLRRLSLRWVVERFFAWMKPARRLLVRFDKSTHVFQAFLDLFSAMTLIKDC